MDLEFLTIEELAELRRQVASITMARRTPADDVRLAQIEAEMQRRLRADGTHH